MKKLNYFALLLVLGLSSCATINEPTLTPQESKFSHFKHNGYVYLQPTQAKSTTHKRNVFFGLSGLKHTNPQNLKLTVQFININNMDDVKTINQLRLIIDGKEYNFKNRNSDGIERDMKYHPNTKISKNTKDYEIPYSVYLEMMNANTVLYEVNTNTYRENFTHQGYLKKQNKLSTAYKSFLKFKTQFDL